MDPAHIDTIIRLTLSIMAGSVIGLERTYHGRPAGFRTHTLVCVASALLMQFTVYQWALLPDVAMDSVRIDPTRMAQGIMTGIGFLGAGVIMREGITIRGLTTAASIWITSAIGVVVGMGMYFAGFLATVIAIGVLSLFRWLEHRTPTLHYGRMLVRFKRAERMSLSELRDLVSKEGVEWVHPSYRLEDEGRTFCYEMTVRTRDPKRFQQLSEVLVELESVNEFSIQPTGD